MRPPKKRDSRELPHVAVVVLRSSAQKMFNAILDNIIMIADIYFLIKYSPKYLKNWTENSPSQ